MDPKQTETQLKELTEICKQFQGSMQILEKNQRDLGEAIKTNRLKEEILEDSVSNAINETNQKLETLGNEMKKNKNIGAANLLNQDLLPNPGIVPFTTNETKNSRGFADALKTVNNPSFLYQGNPKEWPIHKKKLTNLIWALGLTKIEAVKIIKMSFTGKALFIAENIDAEDLINQMNGDNNGYEGYLTALGNLFVGKAEADLSRTKFSNATQERAETIPLFASRILSLFKTAFPDDPNPSLNILVKDKFINGLKDTTQKRFILERKRQDDP